MVVADKNLPNSVAHTPPAYKILLFEILAVTTIDSIRMPMEFY